MLKTSKTPLNAVDQHDLLLIKTHLKQDIVERVEL
jgi:hypothetical protein